MKILELYYTGEPEHEDSSGVLGFRGRLIVQNTAFHTVARAEGYKWLRPAVHDIEHAYITMASGKTLRGLRVLGYGSGRIYLHCATQPSQLTGCIGVGLNRTIDGIRCSSQAMTELFELLGGFRKCQREKLIVRGQRWKQS